MQESLKHVEQTKQIPTKGLALLVDVVINKFWDLMKLNLLILVSSIFVVSIPAAITAGCRIVIMMLRHEHYFVYSDYFYWFKKEFLRSLLVGVLFTIAMVLCSTASYLYLLYFGHSIFSLIFLTIGVLILALLIISLFHCYSMLAFVDLQFGSLLKNSWLLAMARFASNFVVLIIIVLFVALHIYLWPYSLFLVIIISLSIMLLLSTFVAYENIVMFVLKKEESEDGNDA